MKRAVEIKDLYKIKMISNVNAGFDGSCAIVETVIREKPQDYHSVIRIFKNNTLAGTIEQGTSSKSPKFSGDGTKLYFLSDQSGTSQIWCCELSTMESRKLTTHRYGIREFVLSPDETVIYAVAQSDDSLKDEEELYREVTEEEKSQKEQDAKNHAIHVVDIVHKWDGEGYLTKKKTHIFSLDPVTGTMKKLTEGEHNFRELAISHSGTMLTFVSDAVVDADIRPIDIHLWMYDTVTGNQELLIDGALQVERPAFMEDDRSIVFAGMDGAVGWETINRLWKYDIVKKGASCITPEDDFDYSATDLTDFKMPSPNYFQYDSQKEKIYFLGSWHGNNSLYADDGRGNRKAVIKGERIIQSFALSGDGSHIYFIAAEGAFPGKLYCYSLSKKEEKELYNPNEEFLKEVQICVPERMDIKAFDDLTIGGWLIKPYGFEPSKKYPVVLEIHGGPGCMYSSQFMHEFQVLAAAGYVVAFFNPRGSTGYGQRFQSLIQRRFGGNGGGDYEDLMSGVDEVVKLPYVDGKRLFVTGGSYGGFMTNWIVGHTDRFRAAVTQRSISNWSSFIGSSDYGFCEAELGHQCDFFTEQFEMQRISPISYVKNINTPLMILHSDHDYRCPLEQAEQLFTELKLLKKVVEMKIFPDQSHGLSRIGRPVLREERLQTILDWFERYGGNTND